MHIGAFPALSYASVFGKIYTKYSEIRAMDTSLIFFMYLLLVNIVAFSLMGADKRKAKRNERRISEKTLFTWAIIGGSVGSIAGMYFFRHKTKHPTFKIGLPFILLLQIFVFIRFLLPLYILT
jgi:uncharacterized membrane protein YsdA (DUF1294 family)